MMSEIPAGLCRLAANSSDRVVSARETDRAPKPSGPNNGHTSVLQHAEEEPLDLAGSDRLEVLCDQIDMPILEVDRGRLDPCQAWRM
jgi:hypothetical protein